MTKINYYDLPKYMGTQYQYKVNVPLEDLSNSIERYAVDLDPDFQRGHVWNREQQVAYVEHILKGGMTALDIVVNIPGFSKGNRGGFILDGKQRYTAVAKFCEDEFRVFATDDFEGYLYSEIQLSMTCSVTLKVTEFDSRADCLRWYLDFNSGGVVHSKEELDRVRELLKKEVNS